jgi:hypothetical protein
MAKKSKLDIAVEELGKYFGVTGKSTFVDKLLEKENIATFEGFRSIQDKDVKQTTGEMLLGNLEGGYRTAEILKAIDTWLQGTPPVKSADSKGDDSSTGTAAAADEMRKIFEVLFEPDEFPGKSTCVAKVIPKIGGSDGDGEAEWFSGSYNEELKDDASNGVIADPGVDPDEADLYEADRTPSIGKMVSGTNGMLDEMIKFAGGVTDEATMPPKSELAAKLMAAATINTVPSNPTKATPVLSAFMIKPASLTPCNRDTGALGLFLNFIPTVEMSRCQPWLDIQIISAKPALNTKGQIQTMSLAQFLMGNAIVKEGTADYDISNAVNASILRLTPPATDDAGKDVPPESQIATAGMELFTAPQTLVPLGAADPTDQDMTFQYQGGEMNHDAKDPGGFDGTRAAPIIDKFRPFMTISGFSVSVTPSYGMMSHETATLSITLHDRSRLSEIGELVKPDLYGAVELLIEYGWNHPDAELIASTSINPIGNFLDAMKIKKKFKVRNSSFSFDEVGQVEITIELFSVGLINVDTSHIGKMPGMESTTDRLNAAIKVVRSIKAEFDANESGATDTTGETFSLGAADSVGEIMGMDDDTLKKMNEYIESQRKAAGKEGSKDGNQTAGPIADALEAVKEAAGQLKSSVKWALWVKEKLLTSSLCGDPFWRPILPPDAEKMKYFPLVRLNACSPAVDWRSVEVGRADGESEAKFTEKQDKAIAKLGPNVGYPFVSLGKIMLLYVGTPLATDAAFDEVQFYFYAFNADASFMYTRNIAEFPIRLDKFEDELKKITSTSAFVSLRRFLGMLQSKFIGKVHYDAWGLSSLYEINKEGNRVMKEEWKKDPKKLKSHKDQVLAAAYGQDIENPTRPLLFRKPRLTVQMDGMPAIEPSEDGVDGKITTILRIHVYDKACTSYTGIQALLQGKRKGQISAISKEVRDIKRKTDKNDRAGHEENLKNLLDKAANDWGLLEENEGSDPTTYKVMGGFPKLKAFIKSSMPSATYGTSTSAIISASVSSMNDPQLASIMMQRASKGGASTAISSRETGVPLRTVPVEVDLEIFGCPIVSYGQQIFLDFGTGTTVDNIYAVNGIDHDIKSGEFTTKIKLVQLDAFGSYEGALTQLNSIHTEVAKAKE